MYKQDDLTSTTTHAMDGFSSPGGFSSPDGSVAAARLLELATRSADELLDDARTEANSLVATAQADADQLAAASRAEAEALRASAGAEADQLLAAARTEAERLRAELEQTRAERAAEISRLERLEQGHRDLMRSHLTQLLTQIEPAPGE